jgi:sulfate-transporting ATPase
MNQVIEFGILGLAVGGLYVLFAAGIVVVYRGSGVVNFAHGAISMVATYIFWQLFQKWTLPWGLAFVAAIVAGAIVSTASYLCVMRPLRNAGIIPNTIGTLAILLTLESVASYIVPNYPLTVGSELPTSTVKIFGAPIGQNELWIFGISLAIVAILRYVYGYTHFGRATSAVVESRRSAAALAISPDRIAMINWAIGGGLAGLAGVFLAPISGLTVTQFTELTLPGLAAAVIGGFESFGIVLVGGLAIGVMQSEMSRYVTAPGWPAAAPFILVIVVLVIRGSRQKDLRQHAREILPNLGSGQLKWLTFIPMVIIGYVLLNVIHDDTWVTAITVSLGTAVILLSFVVITGYSGQLSLAQWSMAGWGAWVAGRLVASHNTPFLLALIIGMVAALPVGLLVGYICLRTRGIYLAIVTLGLAVAFEQILFLNTNYTGGALGTTVGPPSLFGYTIDPVLYPNRYVMFVLGCFIVCAVVVANLRRSRTGRRLIAVRGNERAAASLGINVGASRVYAFTVGSAIAALGGVLIAFQQPTILYSSFDALDSINLVAGAVIGGVGWIAGPLAGSSLQTGSLGTRIFQAVPVEGFQKYLPLFAGLLLIIVLLRAPDGIAFQNWREWGALRAKLGFPRKKPKAVELSKPEAMRLSGITLHTEDLTVRYGGVLALDNVSLDVRPGEIVGLIGPNGAGKTTFIDAVTGFAPVASGRVRLDDRVLTGQSAHTMARLGLGRSFQSLELFEDISVLDNLRTAGESNRWWSYLVDLVWPTTPALSPTTLAVIDEFDLADELTTLPSELPYGRRRLVAIARAVAAGTSVLLLDEPAAGLDHQERAELSALVRRLARDWGMSVLLIEHDVAMVLSVCDRIHVLNFGKTIASGLPDEIRHNEAVLEAYLGTSGEVGPDELSIVPDELPAPSDV